MTIINLSYEISLGPNMFKMYQYLGTISIVKRPLQIIIVSLTYYTSVLFYYWE